MYVKPCHLLLQLEVSTSATSVDTNTVGIVIGGIAVSANEHVRPDHAACHRGVAIHPQHTAVDGARRHHARHLEPDPDLCRHHRHSRHAGLDGTYAITLQLLALRGQAADELKPMPDKGQRFLPLR